MSRLVITFSPLACALIHNAKQTLAPLNVGKPAQHFHLKHTNHGLALTAYGQKVAPFNTDQPVGLTSAYLADYQRAQ